VLAVARQRGPDCTDLVMRSDTVGRETFPFQTIDDIHVAPIPDGHGETIPALLVHATTSGGAHVTRGLFVWRFMTTMNGFFGPELFVIPKTGVQCFFTAGPFNGFSVTVAAEWITQVTFVAPRPYGVSVCRVTETGCYPIPQFLTLKHYHADRNNGRPPGLSETLMSQIAHNLPGVYPNDIP